MLGSLFYHGLIRKYIILFGTLFNDIQIVRYDANGNDMGILTIPLTHSPKDKMLSRLLQDPEIQKKSAITLPRMSFELINIEYDASRKLQTLHKISYIDDDKNKLRYTYNEVPYLFNFQLSVYGKNAEDITKIVEQILPYFTPDTTATVHLIPELNITKDIPVILVNIGNIQDSYDTQFEDRRAIIWTLSFTMKGYLYGPVRKNSIIKFANTTFRIPDPKYTNLEDALNITPANDRVTVAPGLDANGNPTSNADNSIDRNLIIATDNFGYINDIYGIILDE